MRAENANSPEWRHQFLIDDLVFASGRSPDTTNQCGGMAAAPLNSRTGGPRARESGDAGCRLFGGRRHRSPITESEVGAGGGANAAISGGDANRLPGVYRRSAENVVRSRLSTRKTTGRRRPATAKPGAFTFWKPASAGRRWSACSAASRYSRALAGKDRATECGRVEIIERRAWPRGLGCVREKTEAMSAREILSRSSEETLFPLALSGFAALCRQGRTLRKHPGRPL